MQSEKKDPRLFVKNGREIRLAIIRKGYAHVKAFCLVHNLNYNNFRQGIYGTTPACKPLLHKLKTHKLKTTLGGK